MIVSTPSVESIFNIQAAKEKIITTCIKKICTQEHKQLLNIFILQLKPYLPNIIMFILICKYLIVVYPSLFLSVVFYQMFECLVLLCLALYGRCYNG